MTKRLSIDPNLKFEDDKSIRYVGDQELHVLIPRFYEKYQMVKVESDVTTLGIFTFWYNEEEKGQFFLPAILKMQPSTIVFKVIEGQEYIYCIFHKGDIFMKSSHIVKTQNIAFAVFDAYLAGNHLPSTIKYDDYAFLFHTVAKITGSAIGNFNNVAFELLFAHTSRCRKNVQIPYRLTDLKYFKRSVVKDGVVKSYVYTKPTPFDSNITDRPFIFSYNYNNYVSAGYVNINAPRRSSF